MIDFIKDLIIDFQNETHNTGVPRRLVYEIIKGKAFVCMGVRRCGKSTLLYQIVDGILKKGVKKENILYMNFFNDRLDPLRHSGPAPVLDAYFSLYPEKKGTETIYCFFDEIQETDGWERFISRMLATEKCQIFISGSSARMLSKEIATQMRGRSLAWELFPFSFAEFLDWKNIDRTAMTSRTRLLIKKAFDEYFRKGGFPETASFTDKLRVMVHQEYFRTIIHRDIAERNDAPHPRAILDLAHRLAGSTASLYSLNRLYAYLRSLEHSVEKHFVPSCLEWFEDAYFLFSVKMFDSSVARQNVNPKKIYCVDHALVCSVDSGILVNSGHLLENMVYMNLRRKTDKIFYYRTAHNHETDFVWFDEKGKKNAVQACYSLRDLKTNKREVAGAFEAVRELGIKECTIVTYDEENTITEGRHMVRIVPAWKYLIEGEERG